MSAAWPRVVTFDCYGTLVQWPETLKGCFRALLPPGADVDAFHRAFAAEHAARRAGVFCPYGEILREALSAALRSGGYPEPGGAGERLLRDISDIPPYPEVPQALARLAGRCRLAIISNTEDVLIAATVRGLGAPFTVFTAEQARAYKPDHRVFRYAFDQIGCSADDVLHVGAGYATDMVPAFEMSLARVWINRRGEAADPRRPPTRELPDLARLPELVGELQAERA